MNNTLWHTESCGEGRQYMLGHETANIAYPDPDSIIAKIEEGIRPYLFAEPAIRLTLDCDAANPERVVLSIPCESDYDTIIRNFAQSIYASIMGYYASAEPKSSHFGISHSILDGQFNSLLRREIERHFHQIRSRPEMAAMMLQGVEIKVDLPEIDREQNQLTEVLAKGLNIYVGYRIHAFGELINNAQMFVPVEGGQEIIDLVYYNLEQLINQNFLSYDESGDRYLEISDTLVYKELGSVLQRSRLKENTRKKILNNLAFNRIQFDPAQEPEGHGDSLYDSLNHIQGAKLKATTVASSKLYASVMNKAASMAVFGTPTVPETSKAERPAKVKVIASEETGKTRVPAKRESNKEKPVSKKLKEKKPAEEKLEELTSKS